MINENETQKEKRRNLYNLILNKEKDLNILIGGYNENASLFNELLHNIKDENAKEKKALNLFKELFNFDNHKDLINNAENDLNEIKKDFNKTYDFFNPTYKENFIIVWDNDKNDYMFIEKRFLINRKTNIDLFFYKLYKSHEISKYEFKIYKKYGKLSYNMKNRLRIYLTNEILKIGHRKKFYVGETQQKKKAKKLNNLYYHKDIKRFINLQINAEMINDKNIIFLNNEINQKINAETDIKTEYYNLKLYY